MLLLMMIQHRRAQHTSPEAQLDTAQQIMCCSCQGCLAQQIVCSIIPGCMVLFNHCFHRLRMVLLLHRFRHLHPRRHRTASCRQHLAVQMVHRQTVNARVVNAHTRHNNYTCANNNTFNHQLHTNGHTNIHTNIQTLIVKRTCVHFLSACSVNGSIDGRPKCSCTMGEGTLAKCTKGRV